MNMKIIDKIVWWIPLKNLRNKIRDILLNIYYFNERIRYLETSITQLEENIRKIENLNKKQKMKISRISMFIPRAKNDYNETISDYEKRNILRKILITEDNRNKSFLHNYFINNESNAIHKHLIYFDVYERYFSKFRGMDVNILEIGVQSGGSIKMWKEYFSYNNAKVNIYGVDIDDRCKQIEGDDIKIFIGSQSDRNFLTNLKKVIPKVDILIDDGGHEMKQQIVTFEEMYSHVKDNGIYLCEDLLTSYFPSHNGGYKKNTFIEYSKNLIDYLNAYAAVEGDDLEVSDFTNSTYALHYHEFMLVIEKKLRDNRYNSIVAEAVVGNRIIQWTI